MPYWTPSDEVRYTPEALSLANSLFPDKPHENPFFTEAARSIFAYLVARYKPTPELLGYWMRHFEEIDQRLEGTALAPFVAPTAGGQRATVQSTFNQIAAAFRLLPTEGKGHGRGAPQPGLTNVMAGCSYRAATRFAKACVRS